MSFDFIKKGYSNEGVGKFYNKRAGIVIEKKEESDVKKALEVSNAEDATIRTTVADRIIEDFKPLYGGKKMWLYDTDRGAYFVADKPKLENLVEIVIDNSAKNSSALTKAVINELQRRRYVEQTNFNHNQYLVNLYNCTYDIKKRKRISHSADFSFNYSLNADFLKYDKETFRKSKTYKFLATLCSYNYNKYKRLQESCGILISQVPFKGAVFFIGAHDSGKSTLANLIQSLYADGQYSSVPLTKFGEKFGISSMEHSLINIDAESSKKTDEKMWRIFKQITGGDVVNIEPKNVNAHNARLQTKLLFLGNFMPNVPKDDALNERIQRCNFTYTVPENERDRELPQKLWEERDLFVSWAIRGAVRYVKNGFKLTEDDDEAMEFQSPFNTFINEFLVSDPEGYISTADVYKKYKKFCKENYSEYIPPAPSEFKDLICTSFPDCIYKRKVIDGSKPHVYEGLSYRM